jgi:hypothetical protein
MTASPTKAFIDKHSRPIIACLAIIILVIFYFSLEGEKSPTALLAIALIPNLIATILTALVVYLLLTSRPGASRALEMDITSESISRIVRGAAPASSLIQRTKLPRVEDVLKDCNSIILIAVSGKGFLNRHTDYLEKTLASRLFKSLTVVLMDPASSEALKVWDRISNPPMTTPKSDIESGVEGFKDLFKAHKNAQLRLLDTFIPYSILLGERENGEGVAQVEFYPYRRAPDTRPSVQLSSDREPEWFSFFKKQAEQVVAEAKIA